MTTRSLLSGLVGLFACLFASLAPAALQCTQVFPGGIQSHSPTGFIQMGYKSRVYGSGPTLNAPAVTHTHSWEDQVGLCDGVKCTATGQHAASSAPTFQTGSLVPGTFRTGNAVDGPLTTESGKELSKTAGDYGAVTVAQESTLRFTSIGGTYLMRGVTTRYKSVLEFAPGEYWIDGSFTNAEQTVIRPQVGSAGVVRLYVRGSFKSGYMRFEGFSAGQIELYVQGDVQVGENFRFPGPIHATGKVEFGTHAKVEGGVFARQFAKGNSATITYPEGTEDRYMGILRPDYNATFELGTGSYWIDGDLDASVASRIRKLPGAGTVRLFVRGDIQLAYAAQFEGFAPGELLMYATGDITLNSQKDIPAFVYATGDVRINFSGGARYRGGITGRSVYIGQESIVEYLDPVDLGDLCDNSGGHVVDHYRLSFSTPQFSCEPIPVLIRACADANCSRTVSVTKTLTLTPANRWLGNGTVTFANTDTATAYLKRIPGTPRLGVVGESYRCNSGDCGLEIQESGFAIRVPALIAGQEVAAEVQAMRLDESSGACVADGSFASSERTVALWSAYSAPDSGSRAVWIAGGSIGTHAGDASLRTLRFDAQARSGFPIRYDDAGALDLHVRYLGSGAEDGLDMKGSTTVVSRPYGFCIETGASLSGCSDADCPLFAPAGNTVRAGEPFDLRITPVALPADGNLCAAQPTPNFTGPLELRALVQELDDGVDGPLEIDRYAHPLGGRHELQQKLHEVGIFSIEVHSTGYLGGSDFMSQSAPFGRFAPAYLQARLNTPELKAGCVSATGSFSYQDQPIEYAVTPELTITGKSSNGAVTRNYDRGAFWKLGDTLAPTLGFAPGQVQDASRLSGSGDFKVIPDATSGDGEKAYLLTAGHMVYQRAGTGPAASDVPFSPNLLMMIAAGQLSDSDGTRHGAGSGADFVSEPFGFQTPGGEIRLGRIRVGSAHGPEHAPLDLPYQVETWQSGNAFVPDGSDACAVITGVQLGPYTGQLEGKTQAQVSALAQGRGVIRLTAPGPGGEGSVVVTPQVPDWLTYDWKGDGFENPSGLATFGIYKGNEKIIFRREVIGR